jgi:hypothetical protein
MNFKAKAIVILIALASCVPASVTPFPTNTPRPTVTRFPPTESVVLATVPTSTPNPTFTSTPVSNSIYYMIVVDSSVNMSAPFDGKTKLDAARESVATILAGLDPAANYGLLLIGGAPAPDEADTCNQPSVVNGSFASLDSVGGQIERLQPLGGGSMYQAFFLARRQFEGLPPSAILSLVLVTDSVDECSSRDEWKELENLVKVMDEAGLDFHTEIILLEPKLDYRIQLITDRIEIWSKNVVVHIPQDFATLRAANETALGNITNYVTKIIASRPSPTPARSSYTLTPIPSLITNTPGASSFTLTPLPGLVTNTLGALSYTLTPIPGTATQTPTDTSTPAPQTFTATSTPSVTPTPTPTLPPLVELVSYKYRTTGVACLVEIFVKVTGSPATGSFHVLNSSNGPNGQILPEVTLPVGNYGNNVVALFGNQPATYKHDVWFEYNGGFRSNRFTGLICPLLPTFTPTP